MAGASSPVRVDIGGLIMIDEKAKVSFYDENDDEPVIVLPIPYDDEAAEEARQREAAERERLERIAALKSIAPEIVPSGYTSDQSEELMRKKADADKAKAEYEAALEKLKQAEAAKQEYEARVAEAAKIKQAAEAAQVAANQAEVEFDEEGNSIVKISVPKEYDVVINFKPKKK